MYPSAPSGSLRCAQARKVCTDVRRGLRGPAPRGSGEQATSRPDLSSCHAGPAREGAGIVISAKSVCCMMAMLAPLDCVALAQLRGSEIHDGEEGTQPNRSVSCLRAEGSLLRCHRPGRSRVAGSLLVWAFLRPPAADRNLSPGATGPPSGDPIRRAQNLVQDFRKFDDRSTLEDVGAVPRVGTLEGLPAGHGRLSNFDRSPRSGRHTRPRLP